MAGRRIQGAFARMKEMMMEYAYLITLGAVVAVVAATALYTSRVHTQSAAQAAASAPETQVSTAPSPTQVVRTTPLPTIAPLEVRPIALSLGGGKVWPVSGEIVRGDSAGEMVLWQALDCYQVHAGVDVAGTCGEDVLCVMDGVVERVQRDALWGWQVTVAQTDGSVMRYAGLATCALRAGQSVTHGQTLGTLGEIPCERELGAHLHLDLWVDGKRADAASLLKSAQRP